MPLCNVTLQLILIKGDSRGVGKPAFLSLGFSLVSWLVLANRKWQKWQATVPSLNFYEAWDISTVSLRTLLPRHEQGQTSLLDNNRPWGQSLQTSQLTLLRPSETSHKAAFSCFPPPRMLAADIWAKVAKISQLWARSVNCIADPQTHKQFTVILNVKYWENFSHRKKLTDTCHRPLKHTNTFQTTL